MDVILEVNKAVCGYANKVILRDISFTLRTGEICCILGPNGVGKTTLFKTILGTLRPLGGSILLDGESVLRWPQKKLARALGYVPQEHVPPFPYRVPDVIVMGRTAHLNMFSSPSKKDVQIAENALESLGASYLKDSIYTEISGGERQMVLIARALTQQPSFLMLDEPTASLDFGNQTRVLRMIASLAAGGLGVVMITHSPEQALLLGGNVALLRRGGFLFGPAQKIVNEQNLRDAYGVDVRISNIINEDGRPVRTVTPLLS